MWKTLFMSKPPPRSQRDGSPERKRIPSMAPVLEALFRPRNSTHDEVPVRPLPFSANMPRDQKKDLQPSIHPLDYSCRHSELQSCCHRCKRAGEGGTAICRHDKLYSACPVCNEGGNTLPRDRNFLNQTAEQWFNSRSQPPANTLTEADRDRLVEARRREEEKRQLQPYLAQLLADKSRPRTEGRPVSEFELDEARTLKELDEEKSGPKPCERADHWPCGEWRIGKYKGIIERTTEAYISSHLQGRTPAGWHKIFPFAAYPTLRDAELAAERHRQENNDRCGYGTNVWRPVFPDHIEVAFLKHPGHTMIVERAWWERIMQEKTVYLAKTQPKSLFDEPYFHACIGKCRVHTLIHNPAVDRGGNIVHIDEDKLHICPSNLVRLTRKETKAQRWEN